jgi:protein gp37
MGDNSAIEWTEATWNPTVGCTKVSEGCDNCYAERLVEGRMRHRYPHGFGMVRVHSDRVNLPLRWRRPRLVFVNSLSDVFHERIPNEWRVEIFAVMAAARRHTFQVLTKRPGPMASLLSRPSFRDAVRDRAMGKVFRDPEWNWEWPLPNVWLGTSVENQKWADVRIPKLLQTPAAVRFLSCEPLLGELDLGPWLHGWQCSGNGGCGWRGQAGHWGRLGEVGFDGRHGVYVCPSCGARRETDDGPGPYRVNLGIDWVIVGGESGPGARPMDIEWARDIAKQCIYNDVPLFVKQLGARPYYIDTDDPWPCRDAKGGDINEFPADLRVREYPREAVR